MALVSTWPSTPNANLDNEQYIYNEQNWQTGAPITKNKLENLEVGIRILATQMQAIINEVGSDGFEKATSNSSWIDKIRTWITGSANGSYSDTNIVSRLGSIDTLNTQQNTRLTNIESVNTTQSTDISSLKTRATNLENRATAIEALDTAQNGRLDSVENKNIEQDGRLDNIDAVNTSQNTEITNLKTHVTDIKSINTTQNNRLAALENELSGSGTGTSGSSRLDNLQTWITGSSDGSYENEKDAIMTRLNTDETDIETLKIDNSTNKTNISNIINEIGGTYTSSGFSNSQISKIPSILEKNDEQDNNINKIKLEVWGSDKIYSDESRIDFLENGLSQTSSLVGTFASAIHRLENEIETATVTPKTPLLRTTNVEDSDTLILESTAILVPEAITLIMLNAATLGQNYIEIQDPNGEILYPIYITNNLKLKANFSAGSLLGIYLDKNAKAYMFNAPLTI